MGHRALIGQVKPNESNIDFQYVHWMLPEGMGAKALVNSVNTNELAQEFFNMIHGHNLGTITDEDTVKRQKKYSEKYKYETSEYTRFSDAYIEILGSQDIYTYNSVDEAINDKENWWLENIYLWDDGTWYVIDFRHGTFRKQLADYHSGKQTINNDISLDDDMLPF